MTSRTEAAFCDFHRAVEAVHNTCRFDPHHVPVVYCGRVFTLRVDSDHLSPAADLDARDFVLGMEALGVRFWIMKNEDGSDRLLQPPGYHMLPAHWIARAEALRVAFPAQRDAEAIAFMRQRGDLAIGEPLAPDPFLAFLADWKAAEECFVKSGTASSAALEAALQPFEARCLEGDLPPVTTAEGAAAALRRVIELSGVEKGQPQDFHLLTAALAFVEGRASA